MPEEYGTEPPRDRWRTSTDQGGSRHIGIGRRPAGTTVPVLVHKVRVRIIASRGQLLRELTLHPRRVYVRGFT
jgi:hypothetical protein